MWLLWWRATSHPLRRHELAVHSLDVPPSSRCSLLTQSQGCFNIFDFWLAWMHHHRTIQGLLLGERQPFMWPKGLVKVQPGMEVTAAKHKKVTRSNAPAVRCPRSSYTRQCTESITVLWLKSPTNQTEAHSPALARGRQRQPPQFLLF